LLDSKKSWFRGVLCLRIALITRLPSGYRGDQRKMVCGPSIVEGMYCQQHFNVVLCAIARQNCSAGCNSWKRCNGERIALRRLRLMVMWIAVVDDHFGDNMFCARLKVNRDLCMERSWKRRDMIGTGRFAASTQSGATKSCHTRMPH
jgi:hypothetical protein